MLSKEQRSEIARKAGKASQASGKANKFNGHNAVEAGRKGGQVMANRPGHMAEMGRKSWEARRARAAEKLEISQ